VAIDPATCGATTAPIERSWNADDCILYALAVGAGRDDPFAELAFTTENSAGVEQRALPTFGALLGRPSPDALPLIGDYDPARLVQAGQAVVLHRPVPVAGTLRATTTITDVADKGSGALVTLTTDSVDAGTGAPLLRTVTSLFVRGAGGFGEGRSTTVHRAPPERAPDHVVTYGTLPGQALLYRLCGDRNPLHSDPAFAVAAGFDGPILHGLCVFGFAGRALMHAVCEGDPSRVGRIAGRFRAPTRPCDTLIVSIWVDDGGESATSSTTTADGVEVISDGQLELRA
jgi:acyl dehydratase